MKTEKQKGNEGRSTKRERKEIPLKRKKEEKSKKITKRQQGQKVRKRIKT